MDVVVAIDDYEYDYDCKREPSPIAWPSGGSQ